jgi:hypothetical protein
MQKVIRTAFAAILAVGISIGAVEARGHGGGHYGGGHSYGRAYYGGGHHTYSHGGYYGGGVGSSHRGGHYINPRTGNRYGRHR